MMKLILSITLYFCLIQVSCQKYLGSIKRPYSDTVIQFAGKQVVFIGNSITDGYVTTNRATDNWPQLFCQAVGATQLGMGIAGQVLQNSYACGRTMFDTATIPVKTTARAAIFVQLSENDIGINNGVFTPQVFKLKLDSLVQSMARRGYNYNDMVLVTPCYMSQAGYDSYIGTCGTTTAANVTRQQAYAQVIKEVAVKWHTVLADLYTYTSENPIYRTSYMADGIHPNNAGHVFIEQFMANLIYRQQ